MKPPSADTFSKRETRTCVSCFSRGPPSSRSLRPRWRSKPPTQPGDSSQLDTLEPAEDQPVQRLPKPTGDAVIDRLNALEARVQQLEAENAQLKQQAELNEGRLETVETRAAKNVQFGWAPTIADPSGAFTFKPRGVIEADAGVFNEREGGYQFNDGTQLRRIRLGFEGTALQMVELPRRSRFRRQCGEHHRPLLAIYENPEDGAHDRPVQGAVRPRESNNSDNYNTFLERGMFTNAFGNAGAERRIGIRRGLCAQGEHQHRRGPVRRQ